MPFPVDEKYIIQAETKLGVRFPDSFREKMKKENGGEIETPPDAWILYPFFDSSGKTRIKRTSNDIVRETGKAKEWAQFPEGAIAIGSNGSGDQLIFRRSKKDINLLGKELYWWDHETGQVHKVVDDFANLREQA